MNLKCGLFASLLLLSCNMQAQLLRGTVKSKHLQQGATLIYNADKNGNLTKQEYIDLKFDKDGNFKFDDKMKAPHAVCTVYLGDYSRNGIFLQPGKTAVFTAVENDKKEAVVTYGGDNVKESKFADIFVKNFELEHFIAFDTTDVRPYDECMAKLTKCYAKVKAALPLISNKVLRTYYAKQCDYEKLYLAMRMLGDKLYKEKKSTSDNALYQSYLKQINVNDPQGLTCLLPSFVIDDRLPKSVRDEYEGDMTDWALANMDLIKKYITNVDVKNALLDDMAHSYFSYGKGNNVDKFWPVFKSLAGENSYLIKRYESKVVATKNTTKGKKAPDTTFTDPEGKQQKLSDFFGKLTYIDVWATWCGPCCKEIPYLEKVVEHYKGNDNIQFISISVDSNHDAWLAKLKRDKPAWKQFNLNSDEDYAFSKAWNISGIPRFIMIDKDGNIYDADALRPSDKDLIPLIDKLIK